VQAIHISLVAEARPNDQERSENLNVVMVTCEWRWFAFGILNRSSETRISRVRENCAGPLRAARLRDPVPDGPVQVSTTAVVVTETVARWREAVASKQTRYEF